MRAGNRITSKTTQRKKKKPPSFLSLVQFRLASNDVSEAVLDFLIPLPPPPDSWDGKCGMCEHTWTHFFLMVSEPFPSNPTDLQHG